MDKLTQKERRQLKTLLKRYTELEEEHEKKVKPLRTKIKRLQKKRWQQ